MNHLLVTLEDCSVFDRPRSAKAAHRLGKMIPSLLQLSIHSAEIVTCIVLRCSWVRQPAAPHPLRSMSEHAVDYGSMQLAVG